MHNPPRVELVPVTTEPDRSDIVVRNAEKRLAEARDTGTILELEDAQDGLVAALARTQQTYSLARIGGAEFPVDDFAVQYAEGRLMLSLAFEAGSVLLGDPSTGDDALPIRSAAPDLQPEDQDSERRKLVVERLEFAQNAGRVSDVIPLREDAPEQVKLGALPKTGPEASDG